MIVPGPDNPFFRVIRGLIYGWILLLVLSLYPFTEDPAAPIKVLLSAFAALLVTIVWATGMVLRRVPFRKVGPSPILLIAFLGWQCVAALLSDAPLRSMQALIPWLAFGVLALHLFQVFAHTRHLRNLFRVVVGSVALSSLYGLLQYFGLDPFPWALRDVEEYRGLPATYGNPNFAGHALVIAIVLCAGLVAEAWRRKKGQGEILACVVAGALLFTHLYLSHMRSGALALALGLFAFGLTTLLHRHLKRGAAWAGGLALTGLLALVLGLGVMQFAPGLLLENSLQLRLHGYHGALALFQDHWATGVGPGNYSFHNILYWTEFESLWYALEGKRNHHVHNEWLEIAIESGIIGVFLLVLLYVQGLFAPYLNTTKRSTFTFVLPLALLVVMLDGSFSFNLHVPVSGALILILFALHPNDSQQAAMPAEKLRWGALALLPVALTIAVHGWWQFQSERSYQQAQGAVAWSVSDAEENEHFLQAAEVLFLASGRIRTWDYRIPAALGNLALQDGRAAEAARFYEDALSLHPHLPSLKLRLGRALLVNARQPGAENPGDSLERAGALGHMLVAQCPGLGEGHALLGWSHWLAAEGAEDQERPERVRAAARAFEKAREYGHTEHPELEFALAQAYEDAGQNSGAAEALLRAIELAPSSMRYWNMYDQLARKAEEFEFLYYRQALLFHLSTGTIKEEVSRTLLAHRLAELSTNEAARSVAEACLNTTLTRFPEQATLWTAWVKTLPADTSKRRFLEQISAGGLQGAPAPVITAFASAMRTPHNETKTLELLASTLAHHPIRRNTEVEERHLRTLARMLEVDDSDRGVRALELGRILLYVGDYKKADVMLASATSSLPADRLGDAIFFRSRSLAHLAQGAAALALAQDALQHDRASIPYQWNFALRLAESDKTEAARFQLEALLPQVSDSPTTRAAIVADRDALPVGSTTAGKRP
jgi:O-antigen ligase